MREGIARVGDGRRGVRRSLHRPLGTVGGPSRRLAHDDAGEARGRRGARESLRALATRAARRRHGRAGDHMRLPLLLALDGAVAAIGILFVAAGAGALGWADADRPGIFLYLVIAALGVGMAGAGARGADPGAV